MRGVKRNVQMGMWLNLLERRRQDSARSPALAAVFRSINIFAKLPQRGLCYIHHRDHVEKAALKLSTRNRRVSMRSWARAGFFCSFTVALLFGPRLSWSQAGPDPKLIENAKKEREVVWYTTTNLETS